MNIDIFEEHSSALAGWWALGAKPRTVIYLDAHLDLQPLDAAAMARLQACQTSADIAALERPHPLDPSPHPAYGLEDWLYPAHRLGLMSRLVWVVPPHVGIGFDEHALTQLCQTDGVTLDDLRSFHRTAGGWLEGCLLGVPMLICSLAQLPLLDLPPAGLIDIDTDYFDALPEDRPWISPQQVFDALNAAIIQPEHVTISRSVSSGFMPERYRYFADWLAALWQGDADQAQGHRAHYQAQYTDTARHASVDLQAKPNVAALLREACAIRHRRLNLDLATLLQLQRQLATLQDTSPPAGWCWAALGLLHARFARLEDAQAAYAHCLASCGEHPELALAIGKQLLKMNRIADAASWFERAMVSPKWRTSALAYLIHVRMRQGDGLQALQLAEQACARAPLWLDAQRGRAQILQGVGRPADAASVLSNIAILESALATVASHLTQA
jgi:hypothetical protein